MDNWLKNKSLRHMTNREARKILISAYNNRLLRIYDGSFSDSDTTDCIQALCMALFALKKTENDWIDREGVFHDGGRVD